MRHVFAVIGCAVWIALCAVGMAADDPRPNILWITSEDNGPQLGCYGDEYADTPNIDALAAKGLIYLHCWSNAPVCAPARTCIISGMYAPSTGSQHMRSMARLPDGFKMYPQLLREAGYYCTNNSKEDYNLEKTGKVWDESSGKAHWKNRGDGQPFFAIFNHTVSHESQIRNAINDKDRIHDPDKVRVPEYHPDTPETRKDWAQYYDRLTMMDARVGQNLKELENAGLAHDTIVFYYGDHGSGMPRSKRWPYNSGLHVPLIVFIPEKFKHLRPDDYKTGGKTDRLVSFVDLAPTLLSLIGMKPPDYMQGHAFAGRHAAPPQPYIYGFRDRMDERYDMVRSVTDGRYVYIRNYMPHRIYGQHVAYMFQTPTTRVWKHLFDEGKVNKAQSHFWQPKPSEELYDLKSDPDEVHNLAADADQQGIRDELRAAQQFLAKQIRDTGFLPEGEIHSRSEGSTPHAMAHDPKRYPLDEIMWAAEAATMLDMDASKLTDLFQHKDSGVRYWAAIGILARGSEGVAAARGELQAALQDDSHFVRIVAAEALGRYGNADDLKAALDLLIAEADAGKSDTFRSMAALNALDIFDKKAAPLIVQIKALPNNAPKTPARMGGYIPRLLEKTLADLQ